MNEYVEIAGQLVAIVAMTGLASMIVASAYVVIRMAIKDGRSL